MRSLLREVEYATQGRTASDIAHRTRPDAVLLDMQLPDTTGAHVARELRRSAGLVKTCIVGITGFSIDRAEAQSVGFDEVLTKPVDLRELKSVLARAAART